MTTRKVLRFRRCGAGEHVHRPGLPRSSGQVQGLLAMGQWRSLGGAPVRRWREIGHRAPRQPSRGSPEPTAWAREPALWACGRREQARRFGAGTPAHWGTGLRHRGTSREGVVGVRSSGASPEHRVGSGARRRPTEVCSGRRRNPDIMARSRCGRVRHAGVLGLGQHPPPTRTHRPRAVRVGRESLLCSPGSRGGKASPERDSFDGTFKWEV